MALDALSWSVLGAAAFVAVAHTALGPDHVVPFAVLARARNWSLGRTLAVTAGCGVAHVASSLLLGLCGVALGVGVGAIEGVEAARGGLAAWALVAFGTAYGLWGLRRALRARGGVALHEHGGHAHVHAGAGAPHSHAQRGERTTSWTLLVVFVLGPCEPLIPLVLAPASQGRWSVAALVAATFSVVTVATMLALVALARGGLARAPWGRLERFSHSLAGAAIAFSGLAVLLLGL